MSVLDDARIELWHLLTASKGLTKGATVLLVLLWVEHGNVPRRVAAGRLGVTVSTVDRHFAALRRAGLVDRAAHGMRLREGTS